MPTGRPLIARPQRYAPIFKKFPRTPKLWPVYCGTDRSLDDAATILGGMGKLPRAKQHRRPAKRADDGKKLELRRYTASVLAPIFRERLRDPHFNEVATIAELLSGLETHPDYVKKVEQQERRKAVRG
jgi:hypothetical protein